MLNCYFGLFYNVVIFILKKQSVQLGFSLGRFYFPIIFRTSLMNIDPVLGLKRYGSNLQVEITCIQTKFRWLRLVELLKSQLLRTIFRTPAHKKVKLVINSCNLIPIFMLQLCRLMGYITINILNFPSKTFYYPGPRLQLQRLL